MTEDHKSDSDNLLLEQYKTYVEMTDRISARRSDANKFYVTILTGLFAVVSFVIGEDSFQVTEKNVVLFAISLFGMLICAIWFFNVNSYRSINKVKFEVIHDIEKSLPYPCYAREWELLTGDRSKYLQFSKVEQVVPVTLGACYLVLLGSAIYGLLI